MKSAAKMSLLLAVTLWGLPARAQESGERVALRWSAPAACPGETELRGVIEAHLGQPLSAPRAQPLVVTGDVVEAGGLFTARLRFESRSGVEERSLDHPECRKLFEAAALVIALAIDPGRVNARNTAVAPAEPVVSPAPIESAPPVQEPVPPPGPAELRPPRPLATAASPRALPAREPASRPRAQGAAFEYPLSVFAMVGAGALPGVAPGVGAEFAVARQHFHLGVGGRYWLPGSQPVAGTPGAEISVGWWAAELRACGVPWLSAWRLRLCAAGGGGELSGRGVGVNNSRTRRTVVPTLSLGATLGYHGRAVAPFVGLVADWLLVQPRYGVSQDLDIVGLYRASPVAVTGVVGLTYRLEQ